MGWPVAGDDNDEDSPPLVILNEILGTTGRRLQAALNARRVPVIGIGPFYAIFHDAGALGISATTQAEASDAVAMTVLDEIARIRAGQVSEQEVQEAIRARIGRRALSGETSLGQTGVAIAEISGELDSFLEYTGRFLGVTPADVQRVAEKYLDPQNHTIVIVRP